VANVNYAVAIFRWTVA